MTPVVLRRRRRDLRCEGCGYGIRVAVPPRRCPMCGGASRWRPAGLRTR